MNTQPSPGRALDPEKLLRRLEKRLAKSEFRRTELEELMDGSQAFQRRVITDIEAAKAKIEQLYASLEIEQIRTEQLLRSIMPESIAEELKANGKVRPRQVESATVMFTDFVDFTKSTEAMDPVALVGMLDRYYGAFDEISAKHGVEKVKTIGDAYMTVAGDLNDSDEIDHVAATCAAAVEIMDYVSGRLDQTEADEIAGWALRIGIHTGPISTGVVGTKRLSFDIWGDTVNTAARMVSACAPNTILLSAASEKLFDQPHRVEQHGDIQAKGKGTLKAYRLRTS
ncbi:adenylate/guanylate cyclase domain-containing protein [Sulfitobacter sp.]|uniref:adenylate/guanylate cyclase domain-containing protein n=1 Tax=Sulfitobacter sp. TaxID=1903071 RepID=UPI003564D1D2|tara:strand:- start:622 stop:1473 length:852 start_codon:yes stop_codon:yes gene_type:complete